MSSVAAASSGAARDAGEIPGPFARATSLSRSVSELALAAAATATSVESSTCTPLPSTLELLRTSSPTSPLCVIATFLSVADGVVVDVHADRGAVDPQPVQRHAGAARHVYALRSLYAEVRQRHARARRRR